MGVNYIIYAVQVICLSHFGPPKTQQEAGDCGQVLILQASGFKAVRLSSLAVA